jgi:hypothetical protein
MKSRITLALCVLTLASACAPAQREPAVDATTVTSATTTRPAHDARVAPVATENAEPAPSAAEPTRAADTAPMSTTAAPDELVAEPCLDGWVCVKLAAGARKLTRRDTLLVGNPSVPSTWSKTTDGRAAATFDAYSKGAVQISLRRKPGNKNEVVAKIPKVGEVVLDRHAGSVDDFTHIGVIAAEDADGALLVDIKYMR